MALFLLSPNGYADEPATPTPTPTPNPAGGHEAEKEKPKSGAEAGTGTDRPAATTRTSAELIKILKESTVGLPWLTAATELIDLTPVEQRLTLSAQLDSDDKKFLLEALVQARLVQSIEILKVAARNAGDAPQTKAERIAAQHEMGRRFADKHTKLIVDYFYKRDEAAEVEARALLLSINDDKQAAVVIDRLMGQINRVQREKLRDYLKTVDGEEKAIAAKLNPAVVRKLLEAAMVSLGESPSTPFQIEFKALYDQTLVRNAEFHRLLGQARAGDQQALAFLKSNYRAEDLLDFAGGQLANKNDGVGMAVAELVSEKRGDDYFLNLATSNAAFSTPNSPVSVYLGKTPAEMRAALEALNTSTIGSHDPSAAFQPTASSGLQLFTLAQPGAAADTVRHVFAAPRGNGFELRKKNEPGRPTGDADKIATLEIAVPVAIPPLAKTPTPENTGDKPAGTPPTTDPTTQKPTGQTPPTDGTVTPTKQQVEAFLVAKSCAGCHDGTPEGKPTLSVPEGASGIQLGSNAVKTFKELLTTSQTKYPKAMKEAFQSAPFSDWAAAQK